MTEAIKLGWRSARRCFAFSYEATCKVGHCVVDDSATLSCTFSFFFFMTIFVSFSEPYTVSEIGNKSSFHKTENSFFNISFGLKSHHFPSLNFPSLSS